MYIICIWRSSCCNPGEWPRHYCSADDKTWGKMSVRYRKAIKIISSQGLYIFLNNLQGRSTCLSTLFVGDHFQLYQSCSRVIAGGFSIWHVLLQAVISRAVKMPAKWFGKGKGSQNSNLPLHHEEEMLVYIDIWYILCILIYNWFFSPKPIVEREDRKNPKYWSVTKSVQRSMRRSFTHHYSIHSGWKILMCSRIFPSFTAIKVAKTVQLATRSCNLRLKKQSRNALFILPPSSSGPCSCVCWLLVNHCTCWLTTI